jgi:hypothetical protein
VDAETLKAQRDRLRRVTPRPPLTLSAATNTHVTEALRAILRLRDGATEAPLPEAVGWQP